MGTEPRSDPLACVKCGLTLLPLTYTLPIPLDPTAVESRPNRKCPGCGQRYQWQGIGGWSPVDSLAEEA